MRVLVQLPKHREILPISVVVIARDLGLIAMGDPARLLLELPPIAVAVVAFDLVGCGGGSPQETVWESFLGQESQAAALAGLATSGGGMYSQATGVSPSISSRSMPALSTDLRYISRSLCGRPSRRTHAALSGSAWLMTPIVSPGCSRASPRTTASTRPPILSMDSSPGTIPRFALCTNQRGLRSG